MFIKEGCLNNLKGAFMNFKRGHLNNKHKFAFHDLNTFFERMSSHRGIVAFNVQNTIKIDFIEPLSENIQMFK